jgi:hypothetical protein
MMPDYSGVAQAMPENIGREKIMDPLVNAGMSLATLPRRSLGSSAEAVTSGIYNPAPIVEAAMLPMGTGGVAGIPMAAGETALGSGIIRPKPATGGYHGTNALDDFRQFKDMGGDVGTSITTSPNVSSLHSIYYPGMEKPVGAIGAGPRTIPVVADINKSMRFPHDPMDWTDPSLVVDKTRMFSEMGLPLPFPKGMLDKMENVAKQTGGLKQNLAPMLKEEGYDAVKFPSNPGDPRLPKGKYNSYMVLDPANVKLRYSPEGQELIKAKGILEPEKRLFHDKFNNEWNTMDSKMRATMDWVLADPGAFATLSADEQKIVAEFLGGAGIKIPRYK